MSVFENVINEANKKNEVKNITPESVEVAGEGEGKKSFARRTVEPYLKNFNWPGLQNEKESK